jgi:hypothetical protein
MNVDLSRVKEIKQAVLRSGDCFVVDNDIEKVEINEKLKNGDWILLDVKIIENHHWVSQWGVERVAKGHLHKDFSIVYVLGRVK